MGQYLEFNQDFGEFEDTTQTIMKNSNWIIDT